MVLDAKTSIQRKNSQLVK